MIFRYKIKFISDIEQKIRKLLVNIAVTPFVGVWIEILRMQAKEEKKASLPSWECGLKFQGLRCLCSPDSVTPFVGVWIEIGQPQLQIHFHSSLPSWECGLKYLIFLM